MINKKKLIKKGVVKKQKPQKTAPVLVKETIAKKPSLEVGSARVAVIGIGGGGSSIVAEIGLEIKKAEFVVANTDLQALKEIEKQSRKKSGPKIKCFQLGQSITQGLGAGMNPKIGELAARSEKEKIKETLKGVDICILVASLGGGTGSGSSIVFTEAAKELGIITIGIFTLPFQFEGEKRAEIARAAVEKMRPYLNVLVIVPNDRIFQITDKDTPLQAAFSTINRILGQGLAGLIETIYRPSLINIDFADLKMILEGKGRLAYLHCSEGAGPERAVEAARKVLKNPLQEYDLEGAERILFNIAGGRDLKMSEVEYISREIFNRSKKAKVVFGISQASNLTGKVRITVLAAGCDRAVELGKKKVSPIVRTSKKPAVVLPVAERKAEKIENKTAAKEPEPRRSPSLSLGTLRGKKPQGTINPENKMTVGQKAFSVIDSSEARLGKEMPAEAVEMPPSPAEDGEAARTKLKIKRTGLELKKAVEEAEREIVKEEDVWETPAFLRREKS